MKKNGILTLLVVLCIGIIYSCNRSDDSELIPAKSDNSLLVERNQFFSRTSQEQGEQEILDFFENYSQKGKPIAVCKKFHVSVGVGIFTVDTDVWYCCSTLTMNCTVIPDGISHRSSSIKEFEVLNSSIYTDESGKNFKIKNGIYKVAEDGSFQLNLEEVK